MEITYENYISAEACDKLRNSAGWPRMHPDQIKAGLSNSAFIIAAKDGDDTLGMARVVSDGGYVYFIVDVIVLPGCQRRGIGKAMMEMVMEYIRNNLRDGYCIQVDLLAAKGREDFYERFGFIKRPNDVFGCGMTQRIKR
jgi:ribosomal protein S18 acetylase RimI-like enzyme